MTKSHGYYRLRQLLEHHQAIVDAVKTTLGLLNGAARTSSQARRETTIAQALATDESRRKGRPRRPRRPKPSAVTQHPYAAHRRDARHATAALLAKLDQVEPRPLTSDERRSVAPLMNHGYLRKKGDGYVRTAKVFTP